MGSLPIPLPRVLDQETTRQHYLDRAGYRTGIFGKYLNSWLRERPPYFDRWAIFGSASQAYSGGEWNVQGTVRTVSRYATHFIDDQGERLPELRIEATLVHVPGPAESAPSLRDRAAICERPRPAPER
jgi:hypothetical protein